MISILSNQSTQNERVDIAYFAILLVAMMGAAVTTLQPLIIGAYTDAGILTDQQVSWVAICDVVGILLTSSSAYFWVRRCHWYTSVVLALVVFIVANFVTGVFDDFYSLAITRFLAGAGCGICYSISLAALGDRPNPDRAFGDMVTAQVIFGTLGFAFLPLVIVQFGYYGIYLFFNIFLIVALLAVLKGVPENNRVQEKFDINLLVIWKPTTAIFLSVVTYYFAQGTVWAYLERIGVEAGLSGTEIGFYLSLGFGISAAGSAISGWFVAKFGRVAATWLTLLIQLPCLLALFFLTSGYAWLIYALATIIYQIFWSFIVPIMMATFSDVDKTGRLIVLCVCAFKIGLVLGTPFAGYLISVGDIQDVIWAGSIAIVLSCIFLVTAIKLLQK